MIIFFGIRREIGWDLKFDLFFLRISVVDVDYCEVFWLNFGDIIFISNIDSVFFDILGVRVFLCIIGMYSIDIIWRICIIIGVYICLFSGILVIGSKSFVISDLIMVCFVGG